MIDRHISLPDDRGTPVQRASEAELRESGFNPDSLGLPSTRTTKPKTKAFEQTQYHWTEAVATFVLLFIVFGSMVITSSLGMSQWTLLAPVLLGSILVHRIMDRKWNKSYAGQYESVLKENALCPSCVHSLKGLLPSGDGCTVCPECGAAWRLPATHEIEPASGETGSG